MKFPVIIIKENESPIYFFYKEEFGLVSKGGETFYINSAVYDSEGTVFWVKGIEQILKAPILKSLKYFQRMFVVKINTEIKGRNQLADFKKKVLEHIAKYPKYWQKRDTIENLTTGISSKTNFTEVIEFLK